MQDTCRCFLGNTFQLPSNRNWNCLLKVDVRVASSLLRKQGSVWGGCTSLGEDLICSFGAGRRMTMIAAEMFPSLFLWLVWGNHLWWTHERSFTTRSSRIRSFQISIEVSRSIESTVAPQLHGIFEHLLAQRSLANPVAQPAGRRFRGLGAPHVYHFSDLIESEIAPLASGQQMDQEDGRSQQIGGQEVHR